MKTVWVIVAFVVLFAHENTLGFTVSSATSLLHSSLARGSRRVGVQPRCSAITEPNELVIRSDQVKARAKECVPFTEKELDSVVASFTAMGGERADEWVGVRDLLSSAAHKRHTEWTATEEAATVLKEVLGTPEDDQFRELFKRVLGDGNWFEAASAAADRPRTTKPWAVLVTGVNGIRKTSTIHQSWFKEVLAQALGEQLAGEEDLPTGENSFFRQLDYIIATIANREFAALYELDDVATYAAVKDSIFARYRTVAEIAGALLVKEARARRMNVMVETSGRDVGMFEYVDHFFPDDEYNKLVVHFTISDIAFAERSVDTRMLREMQDGQRALASGSAGQVVQANAGGPYGSQVLRQVEKESTEVWDKVQGGGSSAARSWLKARLAVTPADDRPWRVSARGGGDNAEQFEFAPLK